MFALSCRSGVGYQFTSLSLDMASNRCSSWNPVRSLTGTGRATAQIDFGDCPTEAGSKTGGSGEGEASSTGGDGRES